MRLTITALLAAALALGAVGVPAPQVHADPQGKGKDAALARDMEAFHFLLDHRAAIQRNVTKLDKGVETLTESDDPKVAAVIQEHVQAMYDRVKNGRPIHRRDPLFDAIFRHANKITMKVEKTAKGVKVVETSDDPFVTRLIQAHAEVVNLFVKNGRAEMKKDHAVPERPTPE